MYLYELAHWLATVVDSLVVQEQYKNEAYKAAVQYIADCLIVSQLSARRSFEKLLELYDRQDFISGPNVPMLNENALSNISVDVDFLEAEFKRIGREHVNVAFSELRLVSRCHLVRSGRATNVRSPQLLSIILEKKVQEYLVPNIRQTSYSSIKPKKLQALLEKLAKSGSSSRDQTERERGERQRKEADAVGRIFPGENRH